MNDRESDRASLLARLAILTAAKSGDGELAGRLCGACQMILGADGAALTIENTPADRTTLSTTDATAARLEDLQDLIGEGPCLDAFRFATPFDLRVDEEPSSRWPEFARAARQAVGDLHVYAFAMSPAGHTIGVLSVYFAGGKLLPEPVQAAQFLASAVGAALLRDPEFTAVPGPNAEPGVGRAGGEAGGGADAWSARARVHQATGMVTAQLHMSPDDAMAIMRAHAYAENTTLAELARQILTRELDFRRES